MAITRDLIISVQDGISTLNTPLSVYRNDRGIDLSFEIKDFSYNFSGENVLQNLNNASVSIIIKKPNGNVLRTRKGKVVNGKLKFTITKDLTDELGEIGLYQLQLQFYDSADNRITIPPIQFEVRKLIADIDDDPKAYPQVSFGLVGECLVSIKGKEGQDIEGVWIEGEYITAKKLNYVREKAINGDKAYQEILKARGEFPSLNDRITPLEKNISNVDLEVKRARVTASGENFFTLKSRLDTEFKRVKDKIETTESSKTGKQSYKIKNTISGTTISTKVEGRTLHNLVLPIKYKFTCDPGSSSKYQVITNDTNNLVVKINSRLTSWRYVSAGSIKNIPFKATTVYTVFAENIEGIETVQLVNADGENSSSDKGSFTNGVAKITTNSSITKDNIIYLIPKAQEGTFTVKNLMILEGDWTEKELPEYFEGVKSVGETENNKIDYRSVGRNLFDIAKSKKISHGSVRFNEDGSVDFAQGYNKFYLTSVGGYKRATQYIIQYNTIQGTSTFKVFYTDGTNAIVSAGRNVSQRGKTIREIYQVSADSQPCKINNILIAEYEEEEGSHLHTPPILFKKEIKTPFIGGLKGNGLIKDEIIEREDGVYLIQKLAKYKINDDDVWREREDLSVGCCKIFRLDRPSLDFPTAKTDGIVICNNFNKIQSYLPNIEGIRTLSTPSYNITIQIDSSRLSTQNTEGFKKWLKENPTEVVYELAEPIEHKISNYSSTSLNTYTGMTTITSTNTIKPFLSFRILLNKNLELQSLRLESDIVNKNSMLLTQQTTNLKEENIELKQIIKIQNNLIDATMEATDEIYSIIEALLPSKLTKTTKERGEGKMIDLYVAMVQRGLKTLEEIPVRYRAKVKEILDELEK